METARTVDIEGPDGQTYLAIVSKEGGSFVATLTSRASEQVVVLGEPRPLEIQALANAISKLHALHRGRVGTALHDPAPSSPVAAGAPDDLDDFGTTSGDDTD